MKILAIALYLLLPFLLSAQMDGDSLKRGSEPIEFDVKTGKKFYVMVENMPEFPGGMGALRKFIAKNTQYPDTAKSLGLEGNVFVRFAVMDDGVVDNIVVVRSVHPFLDDEAVRVVKAMPKWKPGYQDGKAVSVVFTQPINFKLSAEEKKRVSK